MFETLVLSRPMSLRPQYLRTGSVSAVVHTVILALAVYATGRSAALQESLAFDTMLIYVAPATRDEPEQQKAPEVLLVDEPVRGFQTIAAITEIPTELPPIDLAERFDPRDYTGVGVEGGVAEGREVDVAPGTVVQYAPVYEGTMVEEPPTILVSGELQYPTLLRQANIEGRVVLEFVVDPRGRAEVGTIKMISASHPGFLAAARAAVPAMRFSPGRMYGRPVRVWVRVPFDFTLIRR